VFGLIFCLEIARRDLRDNKRLEYHVCDPERLFGRVVLV
jgi:hypothetical protein